MRFSRTLKGGWWMKIITGLSPSRSSVAFSQAPRFSQKVPHGLPGSLVSRQMPVTPSPMSSVYCTKPFSSNFACGKVVRKFSRSSWLPTSR